MKPELLIPAGNMECLKYAFEYGADAVYIGGRNWNLRINTDNFSIDEIESAVQYAHKLNKKIYVTVNTILVNKDFNDILDYIKDLKKIRVDALIISDPGLIYVAVKEIPDMKIHLSTQANTTNYMSSLFWKDIGIKRITLARELDAREIKQIVSKNPDTEFEVFIHGAVCIAYSGRCFLSAYFNSRHANKGDCSHPCRWEYAVLEESKRPGEYLHYEQDERGSHIFNSKDLCLIAHIPELINTGITSFKVEGRMKTIHYISTVTKAYRKAIDSALDSKNSKKDIQNLAEELDKINNRGYTTGFYFNKPAEHDYKYDGKFNSIQCCFCGKIIEKLDNKTIRAELKNKISKNDELEIIMPDIENQSRVVKSIYKKGIPVDKALCKEIVDITFDRDVNVSKWGIIRRKK
ncbi:U32 family peptidase [bacterium]